MKKLLLVLVAVLGLSFAANAQNIGGRFGGVGTPHAAGFGAELSYQHFVANTIWRVLIVLNWILASALI